MINITPTINNNIHKKYILKKKKKIDRQKHHKENENTYAEKYQL